MKTNKKELAEILGIFAVVASLVFVGMQLHLDRKVALAEQYFNRAESVKEDYRTALLSPEYFRAVEEEWTLTGRTSYSDKEWEELKKVREGALNIKSVEAMVLINRLQIVGYDNLYFQYKQGLLTEASWNGLRLSLKSSMSGSEMVRDIFQMHARSTIQPVVEEILKEIEAEQ
ncbi:hypothetical protein [Thalassomonas sp. M1454]|uniref:hypothetical protein n=1 Tax=Thalassomonas sp. M1454 TaxID=2594477 RepID=UPI00117D9315|nr:hypothetical protein [Thalassomonas sp. M1454]TRX56883.1 hypothetical protein FNN08_05045 [Thalassomonas sp. M1454]